MPRSKIFLSIICLLSVLLIISCEVNSDEKELCEESKWEDTIERTIVLRVTHPNNHCTGTTHKADTADYLKFEGSIQKMYCDDTPSGFFDYTRTFAPVQGTNYVHVGQQYQYKFANDKDRLIFKCTVKAYFIDGNIYRSQQVEHTFYFNDIKFDANTFEHYLLMNLGSLDWYPSN